MSDEQGQRAGTMADFDATCAAIRADGFALTENEADLGACAIAAPVVIGAELRCAVGVIVPQQRFVTPDEAGRRQIEATAARLASTFRARDARAGATTTPGIDAGSTS